jgi:hypothetical protein
MLAVRRSLLVLPLVAAALALLWLLVLSGSDPSAARPKAKARAGQAAALDHYTCYPAIGSKFTEKVVKLSDQFETKDTRVLAPTGLCAPTDKNGEGIVDRTAHLVCHNIRDVPGQPAFQPRTVAVTNQFTGGTRHILKVNSVASLCLPSLKSLDGPPPATAPLPNISHYKCYVVVQQSPAFTARRVSLQDQFQTSQPLAFSPTRLCNPVSKNDEPIITQEHLVCYPIRWRAFTRHQLGSLRLEDQMRRTLCVPSTKEIIG